MKLDVTSLDNKKAGNVELSEAVFGAELRRDILFRVVTWQLAKRRAGTHKVKERNEIARTGAKFGNQKGGGGARHGNRRSNIFIGGGIVHGPRVRSHAFSLPKKVRALGLRSALSAKAASGDLVILEDTASSPKKTKELKVKLDGLNLTNALVIDGASVDASFSAAAGNLVGINVLPAQGANVYDILKHDKLVLTKAGVAALEERLA